MRLVEAKRPRGLADAAEWQARVDLAAAHRLAVSHGFSEGIFNHFTLAVPGKDDRYYQIPFGLHWSEVTASVLMEVGYDGAVLSGAGEVEASAFCIHAPIHRLIAKHACVLHTHMPFASSPVSPSRGSPRSARPRSSFSIGSPMTTTTPALPSIRPKASGWRGSWGPIARCC